MSDFDEATFPGILRQAYLRRSTGIISFDDGDDRYYFQQGELFVSGDHPQSGAIHERLAQAPAARPADDQALRRLSASIVEPALGRRSDAHFNGGTEGFPPTLIGPLTTVTVAMEVAVHGADERALIKRLGGEQARYQNSAVSPALQQLPGLESDMVQLMAHLETPTPVATLLKLHVGRQFETLCALAKLKAIGLAVGETSSSTHRGRRARGPRAHGSPAQGPPTPGPGKRASTTQRGERRDSRILNARSLELFSERIAEDLQQDPLNLDAEEHRRRIAHWLQHQAGMSHYELLKLDPRADDEALHQRYRELARQVHPLHVGPLGLKGRGEAFRLLFERVTEAYLVLSDPRRRAGYDLITGIPVTEEVDGAKRQEEKERMASSCYHNALHYLADHVRDYGQAVDLLKEASRLDPKAGYFSLLGQAQAQNPKWRPLAIDSFRRAVELDSRDAGIRVAFADVLEREGDLEGAREQFRAALEDMPNHPLALRGLERLPDDGQIRQAGEKLGNSLRSFFKNSNDDA